MTRRNNTQRIRIRDLKAKADRTLDEARGLVAQSGSAVSAIEAKTLEVLADLQLTAVTTLEQVQDAIDMLTDGVTLELEIKGKTMPVKGRLIIDDKK